MVTTRNMTGNVVAKVFENHPNQLEMLRTIQGQMEDMQMRYEELTTLRVENATMRQEQSARQFMP